MFEAGWVENWEGEGDQYDPLTSFFCDSCLTWCFGSFRGLIPFEQSFEKRKIQTSRNNFVESQGWEFLWKHFSCMKFCNLNYFPPKKNKIKNPKSDEI